VLPRVLELAGFGATLEEVDRVRGVQLTRTERWMRAVAGPLRLRRLAAAFSGPSNLHQPPTFAFYPEFFEQPDPTYLGGMFQSEKFFLPIAAVVRQHFSFRYPATPTVAHWAERIRSGPSAFVHFRRGDYARNAAFASEMGVVGPDYYRRAVERLRAEHPEVTLYVFSDDIDAVEREFQPGGRVEFVRATTHANSFDKVRLMSLCDHAIISNSTFAWWGAWLNPSPAKLVITPQPWFDRSEHDARDLVPAGWLPLPRFP
jgi:hypothetical protein